MNGLKKRGKTIDLSREEFQEYSSFLCHFSLVEFDPSRRFASALPCVGGEKQVAQDSASAFYRTAFARSRALWTLRFRFADQPGINSFDDTFQRNSADRRCDVLTKTR